MKTRLLKILLVCFMISWSKPAMAQNTETIDKDRLQASYELFDSMQIEKIYNETIEATVDLQIKQVPQLAKYRPTLLKFFSKYMSWNGLKDEMARLYSSEFTVEELKEITAFYKTPTGQKAA